MPRGQQEEAKNIIKKKSKYLNLLYILKIKLKLKKKIKMKENKNVK